MKRRRLGLFLTVVAALMSLAVIFVGCDWFSNDDEGGGVARSRYVVVANTYGHNLSVYKIGSDGTLSFVDNVTQSTATEPSMVLLTPNKKFLYVANHDAYVSIFSYNSDNGALTETEGSPVAIGSEPIQLAITPNGKFLYVTDQGDSLVHILGANSTTGDLTYLDNVSVSDIHSVAMHPSGKFVFLGTESEEIWSYAIHTDNGLLTAAPGTPYISGSSAAWVWLQTTHDGKHLFGAGQESAVVLAINTTTGELTEVSLWDTTSWLPKSLVVAQTIPFMYSANWDNNSIGAFKANSDGSIDNVAGMPFAAGVTPKSVAITADSKYLYVANYGYNGALPNKAGEGTVMAYSVNRSTGVLSFLATYDLGLGAGPKFLTALP